MISADSQIPMHNKMLSKTAALPKSLQRLERSCHCGPTRSMADSRPVFKSSTINTKMTDPERSEISIQLLPKQNDNGIKANARYASCLKAVSCMAACKPCNEYPKAWITRLSPVLCFCRFSWISFIAYNYKYGSWRCYEIAISIVFWHDHVIWHWVANVIRIANPLG